MTPLTARAGALQIFPSNAVKSQLWRQRDFQFLMKKHNIDPKRFKGKKLTRRQTVPGTANDYAIRIDGLTVGRIIKKVESDQRAIWIWTMTAPYHPHNEPQNGEEETFEAARDAFKGMFREWLAWASKQSGKVTWD